jgi:hypothetical protein
MKSPSWPASPGSLHLPPPPAAVTQVKAPTGAAARTGTTDTPASRATPAWARLQALCAIARLHQVAADPATLAHQLGLRDSEPVTADDLLRAARHLGLRPDSPERRPSALP